MVRRSTRTRMPRMFSRHVGRAPLLQGQAHAGARDRVPRVEASLRLDADKPPSAHITGATAFAGRSTSWPSRIFRKFR